MDSLEIHIKTPGLDESITTVKELKQHISDLRDKLVTTSQGTTEWDATIKELAKSVNLLNNVQSAAKDGIVNLSSATSGSISSVKELKDHIQTLQDSLVNIEYGSDAWNSTVQELTDSVNKLNLVQSAAKDGIANLSSATSGSISSVKDLKAHIQELRDSLVNIDYGTDEWNSTVQELTTSVDKLNLVQKAEKEQVSINEGSYKSIEAKMKELTQVYKTMSVVTEEDRQKQIALAVEINSLNDELKGLDAAIGNHQREVGNYKAAFEGLKGTFEITTEAGQQLASGFSSVAGIIGLSSSEASSASSAFSALSGTFTVVASVTETLGRSTEAMSKAYEIATEFGDVFKKSKDAETASITANTVAENASTKASKASTAATTAQTAATKSADKATKAFNKTLLTNPITAIIVVIVALIAHLQDIINLFESVGQALGFINDSTNEFADATENLTEKFDEQNKQLDREIKLLEAAGATTKDVIQRKLELAKAQEKETKATLEAAQARYKQLEADGAWHRFWHGNRKEYKELGEEIKKLSEEQKKATEKVLDLQNDYRAEEIKEQKEAEKRREDAVKKRIEDAKKVAEEQKKALEKTKSDAKAAFKAISAAWATTLNNLKTTKSLFDTDSIQSENTDLVKILGKSADEITRLVESTGTYVNGVYHTALHEAMNEVEDAAKERKSALKKQYKLENYDLISALNDKKLAYKKLNDELAEIEATLGKGSSAYNAKLREVNTIVTEINDIIKELNPKTQALNNNLSAITNEASVATAELAKMGDISLAKGLLNQDELIILQDAAGNIAGTYTDILSTAESYSHEFGKKIKSLKSLYDDGIIDFDQYNIGIKNAQSDYAKNIETFNAKFGDLSVLPDQGMTPEEVEQFNAELREAIKYAYSIRPQDVEDILADNATEIAEKAAERSDNVMMKFDAKMKALSMQLVGTVNQSMIEMAAGGKEAAEGLILDSTNQLEQEINSAQSVLGNYLSSLSGFDWDGFFGNSWAKEKEALDAKFESQLEFLNASIQLYKDTLNDPDLSPEMQLQLTDELNALLLEKQTILNEQAEANAERTAKNIQSVFNGVTAAIGVASDFLNAKMNMHKSNADRIMKNEKLSEKEREKLLEEEQKSYNKAFKANKAVQYANTVVNTATAAMSAYSAMAGIPIVGPILGAAAAAAAVAAGAIQIKTIAAQEPEDISGGSSGGASTGDGGAATTPTIDVNALLSADQESQNLNSDYYTDLQASKSQEQKVYVVESDISETQNTTRTQVSQSSF